MIIMIICRQCKNAAFEVFIIQLISESRIAIQQDNVTSWHFLLKKKLRYSFKKITPGIYLRIIFIHPISCI